MVGGRSDVEREEGRTNIEADFSWCGLGLGGSVRVLAIGRSWLGGGSLFRHGGGAGAGVEVDEEKRESVVQRRARQTKGRLGEGGWLYREGKS